MSTQTSHWRDAQNGEAYRRGRPPHPQEVYDVIFRCLGETSAGERDVEVVAGTPSTGAVRKRKLLDVACGTGQVFQSIGHHFDECWGVDISAAQLSAAVQDSRFHYVEGSAEGFVLTEGNEAHVGSFDVITCASAFHWLDAAKFGAHVAPLLRSGGILAMFCPEFNIEGRAKEIEDELTAFLEAEGCWAAEAKHRINRNIDQLPALANPDLGLEHLPLEVVKRHVKQGPVENVVGVWSTISAIQNYRRKYPQVSDDARVYAPGCNPLAILKSKLVEENVVVEGSFDVPIHLFRRR